MSIYRTASRSVDAVTDSAAEITGDDPNQTILFGEVPDVEVAEASTDNQTGDVEVPDLDIEPDTDHTFGPDDI